MHQVAISQSILEKWGHCIDVVFGHLPDVLKHESQTFQDTILHVQLLNPVLVHQGRQHSERSTTLRYDSNSYRCAHSKLSFLHFQVVK